MPDEDTPPILPPKPRSRTKDILFEHSRAVVLWVLVPMWGFGLNLVFQKGFLDEIPNWIVFVILAVPLPVFIAMAVVEIRKRWSLLRDSKILSRVTFSVACGVTIGAIWLERFHKNCSRKVCRFVRKRGGNSCVTRLRTYLNCSSVVHYTSIYKGSAAKPR